MRSRSVLFLSIGASLMVCRFPYLLAGELSPDETFFIAAAEKLSRDPFFFFRAVDFATSGPLNVYPLLLPVIVGWSPDYVSTRLLGLLIIFASIYIIYRTLVLLTDDAVARIAILPAAGAFAVFKCLDFLHCTSEHVSFLLLSLSLYICVKTFRQPQSYAWKLAGLGVLTSAAFLAKMQAVPILACVAVVAIAYVHRAGYARQWWRPLSLFLLGLAPLLLLNAALCVAAGVWHDFKMEYLVGNYYYVDPHGTLSVEVQRFADFALSIVDIRMLGTSLMAIVAAYVYHRRQGAGRDAAFLKTAAVGGGAAVAAYWLLGNLGGAVVGYAAVFSLLVLAGSFVLLCQRSDRRPRQARWFGFLTGAVLGAAVTAAYLPHRPYGHYLLLVVFPFSLVSAWTVVAAAQAGEPFDEEVDAPHSGGHTPGIAFLMVFAALTLACQLFVLGQPDRVAFAGLAPTIRVPESDTIDAFIPPSGRITVWGWNAKPYVGSGRVSGLKDLFAAQLFITSGVVRDYYRAAYLAGLQHHPPELFIDANDTSFGDFAHRSVYGFRQIPEIDSYIQAKYVRFLDQYGQRFYIRRDLAATVAGVGEPRQCDPQALRCFVPTPDSWIPADLPAIQMPEHALVEAVFTPEAKQDRLATVFSNEGSPKHQGFQFLHMENDRYRLGVGWGLNGALSEELLLPQRKPVYLSIEFNGKLVTIVCNGVKSAEMRLPERMEDSPVPITVGSWLGHQRPFLGNIQFFQIRNLGLQR